MADECDFAADMELKAAEAFAAVRLRRLALLTRAVSAEFCECGSPIPAARRAALQGVTLCIHCQAIAERLGVVNVRA